MSSHLLSEIERVCDELIVIESGRLMRTGRISDLTDETAVLAVEVEWDADRLAALLAERGLETQALGRTVVVSTGGGSDGVHDTIIDAVVTLGLPLVRLEQRRDARWRSCSSPPPSLPRRHPVTTPEPAPSGAIYDLGYQGYDGPRLRTRLRALVAVRAERAQRLRHRPRRPAGRCSPSG